MKKTVRLIALSIIFSSAVLTQSASAETVGIIGGFHNTGGNKTYAGLVSSDGVIKEITGIPESGQIESVDINLSGYGIIGGDANVGCYAAIVSPDGVATTVSGTPALPTTGQINSVAINSTNYGIITGIDNTGSGTFYGAFVSPSGTLTGLSGFPGTTGNGRSVAINDARQGLIGGISDLGPYAAVVSSSGVLTTISGPAVPAAGTGQINSVAINSSGNGIIGGKDNNGTDAYVALVSPAGVTSALSGAAPTGTGEIIAVDINDSGQAIIGGTSEANGFYVALVSSEGVATEISGSALPPSGSTFFDAAINSSGAGIAGGTDPKATPIAFLISPTGETTALTGDLPVAVGEIHTVDISDSGIGLIGGYENAGAGEDELYQALVAPNGTVTKLTGEVPPSPTGSGLMIDVAIKGVLNQVDPKSFGSGNTFANSLFALSSVVLKNHVRKPDDRGSKVDEISQSLSLVADATDKIYYAGKPNDPTQQKYAVWLAPFGQYARMKKHDAFPTIRDRSLGALLGFDYNGWEQGMIGGGLAYAFQDIHYSDNLGKGKVNQEFATIYGAWYGPHVTVEASLWGGLYQFRNYRKTLKTITSKSLIHGWLFAPHVSVQVPVKMNDSFFITPFAQMDWVNNWQGKVREHGKSGLNLRIGSHYASVLRSEIGLRLTQYKGAAYGTFKFEEGLSYVNQATFNAKKVSAFYVGSVSTFNLQMFSDKVQNLGALYLGGWFIPSNLKLPEVGVNYQGEWGSKLMSQTLALEVTYRF
ncbi:MAG: autotransporter domain-containing protein [Chlamydiia bacterium]|nr:autotransporter domain-containing protein [Chlamydiia bacterium]